MKFKRYIWLFLGIFLLFSCVWDANDHPGPPETRGVMYVEILERNGAAIDKIETARLLVFKNAPGAPQLELNELFDIPAGSPGEDEVSGFGIILEVSRKLTNDNEKIVVAIINEPSQMKSILDQLADFNELVNLELSFADFLNNDHNNMQNGKTMPMTRVVRTDKVYATSSEAQTDPVGIEVLRAVACVDVYIRKETGVDFDFTVGTHVTLKNTYGKEYLVRNQDGADIFGKIQTVTSGFISKNWSATGTNTIPDVSSQNNGLLLCSFYTPERTCIAPDNADKLILEITALSSQNESRNGSVTLDKLKRDNVETTIDIIERNNIYMVIITVTDKGALITANVLDWVDENIVIEF